MKAFHTNTHTQTRAYKPTVCLSCYPAAQLNYLLGKPTHCSFPPRFQDPPQFAADGAKNSTSSTPFCTGVQNDPVC